MAKEGFVASVEGTQVCAMPRTICFHPDTPGMMLMLKKARRLLTEARIRVDNEARGA
jgi:lactam utilization protein B